MSSHESNMGAAAAAPLLREFGWLPDYVYTGDKFEAGLAFFADDRGRITRFSREPADVTVAKRLSGQAALPGLVNGHSRSWQRVLRGRLGRGCSERPTSERGSGALAFAGSRLAGADLYDTARMAFMEMLLSGITCVGEFLTLHHQPDGTPWPEPNFSGQEILRAAHDTGIRLALFKAAGARPDPAPTAEPALARSLISSPDQFVRELEALREFTARNYPGDEAWVGAGVLSLRTTTLDYLKAVASYAHAQRLRLHIPVGREAAGNEDGRAEYGRTPTALLAELGLVDKRLTVVHAAGLGEEEAKLLGAARAAVCLCLTADRRRLRGAVPMDRLLAAGVTLSLGTGNQSQIDLAEEMRLLEDELCRQRVPSAVTAATGLTTTLWQAATAGAARSLGAPSGALEVGRPADFFTINLYAPSLAGAEPEGLLDSVVQTLERRAIREVWVGGRQRIINGRHPYQGAIISRFVDLQQRLWGGA